MNLECWIISFALSIVRRLIYWHDEPGHSNSVFKKHPFESHRIIVSAVYSFAVGVDYKLVGVVSRCVFWSSFWLDNYWRIICWWVGYLRLSCRMVNCTLVSCWLVVCQLSSRWKISSFVACTGQACCWLVYCWCVGVFCLWTINVICWLYSLNILVWFFKQFSFCVVFILIVFGIERIKFVWCWYGVCMYKSCVLTI